MDNFLNRLYRNPYAPIDSASITRVDDAGNGYDDWNNMIAPAAAPHQQTWGEIGQNALMSPVRIGASLLDSINPYQANEHPITEPDASNWRVPPLATETWNAISAPGRAYYDGMSPEEMQHTAATAAGLMMGGGGLAVGLENSLAARGITKTSDMIPSAVKDYGTAAYKNWKYADEPAVDPRNFAQWKNWAETDTRSRRRMNYADAVNTMNKTLDADMARMDAGESTAFNDFTDDLKPLTPSDTGYLNALLKSRKPEFSVIDGGLAANASKEAGAGAIAQTLDVPSLGAGPAHPEWARLAQTHPNKSGLYPAVRIDGQPYAGMPSHSDAIERAYGFKGQKYVDRNYERSDLGFIDKNGNWLSRDEAGMRLFGRPVELDSSILPANASKEAGAGAIANALSSKWSPESIAERMKQKMSTSAPALGPEARELRDLASELPRPPKREMTPTARGTSDGSAGLKPAVMIDGRIYSGPNHALAALDSGLTIEEASTLLANNEMRDGYVTTSGKFLTRQEALDHLGLSRSGGALTTQRLSRMEGSDGGGSLFSNSDTKAGAGAVANALDERPGIIAYHGSPHDFDKFSLDKIGTGEGAQAYGHGLYFAENEGVAKSYRKNLGYKDIVREFRNALPDDADAHEIKALAENGQFPPKMSRVINALAADDWLGFDYPSQAISASFRENLKNWDPSPELEQAVKDYGNMYQVRINADPNDFLDWDKPLSQQSEKVRNAVQYAANNYEGYDRFDNPILAAIRGEHPRGFSDWQSATGADLFGEFNGGLEPLLNEAGLTGVRYLDGMSRVVREGTGTNNYVVWNEKAIDLIKKYGLLAPTLFPQIFDGTKDVSYPE